MTMTGRVRGGFNQYEFTVGILMLVLECTNMPPYARDIQRATALPVFDIVSLVTMVHGALAAGQPPRPA